jgi:hypothetical protein
MWFEVLKDDHIKEMGCELALKNRRWIEFGHVKERG